MRSHTKLYSKHCTLYVFITNESTVNHSVSKAFALSILVLQCCSRL